MNIRNSFSLNRLCGPSRPCAFEPMFLYFISVFLYATWINVCEESRVHKQCRRGVVRRVSSGCVVPDDADADAASAIMDEADAAEKLEADIPPIAEFDAPEDLQGGMVACRTVGPRSPCK